MLALDRILVPVDFSEPSAAALRRALDLTERTGAEVHVLHVVPAPETDLDVSFDDLPEPDRAYYREVWKRAEGDLDAFLQRVPTGRATIKRVLTAGLASRTVLDYAGHEDIDLVVMGTHGRRGLKRFMLGSVTEEVLQRSDLPVLVVPPGTGEDTVTHVLAPTDFSVAAEMALPVAVEMAELYGARLDVLHVLEAVPLLAALTGAKTAEELFPELAPHAAERLDAIVQNADGALGDATVRVAEGRAAETIVDHAKTHGVDLIVMAKHGLHGVERVLIGSVTERVCRTAPCAVLALPVGDD